MTITDHKRRSHLAGDRCGKPVPAIFVITGIMASGKSTVADLLARQFERGVHLRGDSFRRMIVSGREEMLPQPTPEAERQLWLRHRLTAAAAETYVHAGFTVVLQDVIIGPMLDNFLQLFSYRPLYLVVLAPDQETVAARETTRQKQGYGLWTVEQLDRILRNDTPRKGLWLDNAAQRPDETVQEILHRAETEADINGACD